MPGYVFSPYNFLPWGWLLILAAAAAVMAVTVPRQVCGRLVWLSGATGCLAIWLLIKSVESQLMVMSFIARVTGYQFVPDVGYDLSPYYGNDYASEVFGMMLFGLGLSVAAMLGRIHDRRRRALPYAAVQPDMHQPVQLLEPLPSGRHLGVLHDYDDESVWSDRSCEPGLGA